VCVCVCACGLFVAFVYCGLTLQRIELVYLKFDNIWMANATKIIQ